MRDWLLIGIIEISEWIVFKIVFLLLKIGLVGEPGRIDDFFQEWTGNIDVTKDYAYSEQLEFPRPPY